MKSVKKELVTIWVVLCLTVVWANAETFLEYFTNKTDATTINTSTDRLPILQGGAVKKVAPNKLPFDTTANQTAYSTARQAEINAKMTTGTHATTDHTGLPGVGEAGVASVNGYTGAVQLGYSSVGAAAEDHNHTGTYEPANANILAHISSASIHVTPANKSTWNSKQDALGFTAVPNTRTVNSKALSSNITLNSADIGAEPALGNPPANGMVPTSTTGGVRSWTSIGSGALINALNYGADSECLVSNDDVWDAMLADVPSTGGTLYFPTGCYYFTKRLLSDGIKPLEVRGDGAKSTSLVWNNPIGPNERGMQLTMKSPNSIKVQGLRFQNNTSSTTSVGLSIFGNTSTANLGLVLNDIDSYRWSNHIKIRNATDAVLDTINCHNDPVWPATTAYGTGIYVEGWGDGGAAYGYANNFQYSNLILQNLNKGLELNGHVEEHVFSHYDIAFNNYGVVIDAADPHTGIQMPLIQFNGGYIGDNLLQNMTLTNAYAVDVANTLFFINNYANTTNSGILLTGNVSYSKFHDNTFYNDRGAGEIGLLRGIELTGTDNTNNVYHDNMFVNLFYANHNISSGAGQAYNNKYIGVSSPDTYGVSFNPFGLSGGQKLIGGTAATDTLTFQSTTGNQVSGTAFRWLGGNNGGTEKMKLYSDGKLQLTAPSGTNRDVTFYNPATLDNAGMLAVYSPSETNAGSFLQAIPKGTGFSGGLRAQISVFNTDYVADSTNYEVASLLSSGSSFKLSASRSGTGAYRPIEVQAGGATRLTVTTRGPIKFTNISSGSASFTNYTCNVNHRGEMYISQGGGGSDQVRWCGQTNGVYSWRVLGAFQGTCIPGILFYAAYRKRKDLRKYWEEVLRKRG